jgi:hypothetical protein
LPSIIPKKKKLFCSFFPEFMSKQICSSVVLIFFYCLCFCNRSLTIGQMQGKFQMIVVRHTGHAIHEDVPDEFATLVINFISRNQIGPNGVVVCIFFISYQCCLQMFCRRYQFYYYIKLTRGFCGSVLLYQYYYYTFRTICY